MPVAVEELQLGVLAAVVRGERHRHPFRTGHLAILDALAVTEVREDFAAGRARDLVVRSGSLALRVRQHFAALRLDAERLPHGGCAHKDDCAEEECAKDRSWVLHKQLLLDRFDVLVVEQIDCLVIDRADPIDALTFAAGADADETPACVSVYFFASGRTIVAISGKWSLG